MNPFMATIRMPLFLDALDRKALELLAQDGRLSWADLAAQLKLTGPSAAERVRKLEQRGLIRGYAALLDPELLGLEVTAFVAVRLAHPRDRERFVKRIRELDGVLECHHVAGDDDYLLKVRVANLRALEQLVSSEVKAIAGVTQTRTTIAMSTSKRSSRRCPRGTSRDRDLREGGRARPGRGGPGRPDRHPVRAPHARRRPRRRVRVRAGRGHRRHGLRPDGRARA